jgi:hypothetical protein
MPSKLVGMMCGEHPENGVLGNYPDEIVEESCDVCGPLHISLDYHA